MVSSRQIICGFALAAITFLSAEGTALADPPARVGRLSYAEGTVSFHSADQTEWSPAQVNYPVTTGNSFWTEPSSRTEIQVGGAELRMDQSTELDVTTLDDNSTVLTVPQGVINVHLGELPPGGMLVETPGGEVSLLQPGSYHIDAGQVDPNNPNVAPPTTQVMVLQGQANFSTPNSQSIIMAGENAVVGTNPPSFTLAEGQPTDFDNWALAREKREMARQTPQYVSPQVTGYEDLDDQGQWVPSPQYGQVWYPQAVQADWAPYRYGHWAYVAPWGWTWIDDAPWGFAPFHYGRWVNDGSRWGWVPGDQVARPVYAPALVAFVGGGGGGFNLSLSVGGGGGAVGWVPLAPHEVFHPYYPTSVNYARHVNENYVNKTVINNITVNNYNNNNVTINHYANAGAATVVASNSFAKGAPVHAAIVHVSPAQLANAKVTSDFSHITPTPAARLGGGTVAANNVGRPAPAPAAHHYQMPETARTGVPNQAPANRAAPTAAINHPVAAAPDSRRAPSENAVSERPSAPVPASTPRVIRGNEAQHGATPASEVARPEALRPEAVNPAVAPASPEPSKAEAAPHAAEAPQEAAHPAQHGQITPTHQGWQRVQPPQQQKTAEHTEAKPEEKDDKH